MGHEDVVLVATDRSACSLTAADAAVQMAGGLDASIRGVYVVDVNLVMEPYVSLRAELGDQSGLVARDDWIHRFEAFGDATLADLKASSEAYGRSFSGQVLFGGVTESVLDAASEPGVRMLAVGRRGRSTEGGGLGGHFGAIAHHVEAPLLVGGKAESDHRRILVVHDGSEHAAQICQLVGSLAADASVEVGLLWQGDPDGQAREDWYEVARSDLGAAGDRASVLEVEGEGGKAILAAADQMTADLLVMSHFRHQQWVQWLVGSPVEYVLSHDERLVLLA
jgi:nucleotide-binding universal stress UspA family protein